ncbi:MULTISPECIES: NIPSNAP family protein [unclassified Paenibacillus]|uniref:NIPSNAP family protein n=1 Tax=unclassified Paenibacillus TaxID=185978 RepID=UPI001AEA152C|nr:MULTISPECIES: NIPSNAP family protein [unclassified Paenibacillus]MBP1154998.1 L-rhamnose mutarotase [Paenibacillus sp. PvP091]MBP1169619.1 L-rhamnose mutarotase [Paenibacillus sp. PvR098]MBP2440647.1 L-rhamnose mutarotase [Paenibacillus sp. PvP052]
MIYELRIYHIHPGKMQAINNRFSNFTLGIFAKHGMRVADFWEDISAENNRLYYVLEFDDMEARDAAFKAFQSDPEWQKVKSESEKDGPIVEKLESIFLKRVPYFSK